jgi:transposase
VSLWLDKRKKYFPSSKIEAAKEWLEDRVPQSHVARELDQHQHTRRLKRAYPMIRAYVSGNGRQKPDDAELTQLKRQLARALEEIEILKKAAAYFAKHSK